MINSTTFKKRRENLSGKVKNGIILIAANKQLPRNYPANFLPFRQDSSFLYYTGINQPGLYCIIDCDSGHEFLCGTEPDIEDTIWSGSLPLLKELASKAGLDQTLLVKDLHAFVAKALQKKRKIHYLPPYTADRIIELSCLLGNSVQEIKSNFSEDLVKSVIAQRMIKTEDEVAEIEFVIDRVTRPMHIAAMRMALPGKYEYQILAEMERITLENQMEQAFPVICSIRGEVLHNIYYSNKLEIGQLLLVDAGNEGSLHYASDITRTTPVGGKFSEKQKEIYEVVLNAQLCAIQAIKPGISYKDIHLKAAREIAKGLKQLGIMQGDPEEAVNIGAHALFFPHGLGHMLGLDVHDMEDLGENNVGYAGEYKRSEQFGTAYLRLARSLQKGFVLTVEPGIYFIPPLIEMWESEKKFNDFINYSKVHEYLNFGGIRIEDDILVTDTGAKVLGIPIPKAIEEIEALF